MHGCEVAVIKKRLYKYFYAGGAIAVVQIVMREITSWLIFKCIVKFVLARRNRQIAFQKTPTRSCLCRCPDLALISDPIMLQIIFRPVPARIGRCSSCRYAPHLNSNVARKEPWVRLDGCLMALGSALEWKAFYQVPQTPSSNSGLTLPSLLRSRRKEMMTVSSLGGD